MSTYEHDPEDKEAYGFRWTDYLNGATLQDSDWEVDSGLTEEAASLSVSENITGILVSSAGASVGDHKVIKNTIVTSDGRTKVKRHTLKIKEG